MLPLTDWLPITRKEMEMRGWDELDIIIVSGDAYVDHPAFGHAVIARILEFEGYKVGIIPQPNWQDDLRDFKKFGKPRLFFGVTSGCMDSMVNHYTANIRLRSNDAYTPNGEAGFRPDYACRTYTQILKKLYPDTPVIIGGIEASLRRITHYDYWSDSLKPSMLAESGADLLVYGMGEKPIVEIAKQLDAGASVSQLKFIPQTAYLEKCIESIDTNHIELHSHEACLKSKKLQAENFKVFEQESNNEEARILVQKIENSYVVINPPYPTLNTAEIDASFDLPYTRLPHPKYKKRGTIPAYEMIKFSVNIHRGCFGACSFCTISAHQGKYIASRSEESILQEIKKITENPDFKGYISDLGGPSANMYQMKGKNAEICKKCIKNSCVYPKLCPNLDSNHQPLIELYNKAAKLPKIKKIFIGSGIRYDLFTNENNGNKYFKVLVQNHVSGRLKVAPEHTADEVLQMMRKPSFQLFRTLQRDFKQICQESKLNQQLIPYFISSHPGCTLEHSAELAAETKQMGFRLEQVQDFTPTPLTLSTEMYYTGLNPYTLKPVYTARTLSEKQAQNRFFFWYKKENQAWIRAALQKINRTDLLKSFF